MDSLVLFMLVSLIVSILFFTVKYEVRDHNRRKEVSNKPAQQVGRDNLAVNVPRPVTNVDQNAAVNAAVLFAISDDQATCYKPVDRDERREYDGFNTKNYSSSDHDSTSYGSSDSDSTSY